MRFMRKARTRFRSFSVIVALLIFVVVIEVVEILIVPCDLLAADLFPFEALDLFWRELDWRNQWGHRRSVRWDVRDHEVPNEGRRLVLFGVENHIAC